MMVNAAVFTCSICGEASADICAYCTKDACSNHRCARCKRCSDCCECEVPLSAEEARAAEVEAPVIAEPAAPAPVSPIADLLTPEEASVFAVPSEHAPATGVFLPEDPPEESPEELEETNE
jgi:hypothetical protein